jgi:adenosine deaminase
MSPSAEVDAAFARSLPKAELHAHLSGSISRETLHEIWRRKQAAGKCRDLEDPLTAIIMGGGGFVDITTFFPLFDKYIYNLCNDLESVRYAMEKVIEDFQADGVRYFELRTTPRQCEETGMTMDSYIGLVNETARKWNYRDRTDIEVSIILSIDRRMSAKQAMQVVDLAIEYQQRPDNPDGQIVGLDLCGNPCKGNVEIFTPAFTRAKENGLGITVHFAEVAESGTDHELSTILSWRPDRLGHCIHIPPKLKEVINERCLGLELCLSCNVLAGLTSEGFERHHLGEWLQRDCPIALATDDFGIFGSLLSNEYLVAANIFALSKADMLKLSRAAVKIAFAGKQRMTRLLDEFEKSAVMN